MPVGLPEDDFRTERNPLGGTNGMERLNEILAILGDEEQRLALSDETVTALRDELRTIGMAITAGEVEGIEDDLATLAEVADSYEGCEYVLACRAEATAAHSEALATQAARFGLAETPVEPDPEPAPVEPVVPEATPAALAVVPEAVPAPVATVPVPEPVTTPAAPAAPVALPALSTLAPPAAHAPVQLAHTEPRIMRLRDREYVDMDDFVSTIMEARESFQSMGSDATELVKLGRISVDYPEDRQLGDQPERVVNKRINQLLDKAYLPDRWQDPALLASGGFCAPAMPDYSIPVVAGTQRPLAGYLPTVNLPRGRVITITPPTLATIATSSGTTASSAVSVWTNVNDISPGSKPIQTVSCPGTQTIATQAIIERLKFGNFMAMADPENVRAWLELTAAAWARRAEGQLLSQIDAQSIPLTTAQVLGATNDFGGIVRQAAAGIRSRQRMPYNARLRVLIPAWFIDFVGADLAHNHPGDGLERFTQDQEAFVRAMFTSANCNVTFYEDSTDGGTNQLFSTPTSGADLPNFPPGPASTSARVIWYIFPEGTFARGDAGTLDLGIVRDSTLNNTNDYEFFAESWEAIVPHVIESQRITSTLCYTGAGAIDVADTAYCTAS